MAVLAIDTIRHLLVTSIGHRWVLTSICLLTSYMFVILMKEKSAENAIQSYLCGILAHKAGSIAILSDSSTEFRNKVLNKACHPLGIKRLLSNQFHLQGHAKVVNVLTCLKLALTKFIESR